MYFLRRSLPRYFFFASTHIMSKYGFVVRYRTRRTEILAKKLKKTFYPVVRKPNRQLKNTIHDSAVNRYTIYFKDRFLGKIWNTFFSHTLIIAIICRLRVFKSIFFSRTTVIPVRHFA